MIPTNEYENLRRRVRTNSMEMYNFVSSELTKILKKSQPYVPEIGQYIDSVMDLLTDHKHSLVTDIDRLRKIDGYEHWRRTEAENLSDLVQRRLTYLQNPSDCSKARKLVCRLNKVLNGLCCCFFHSNLFFLFLSFENAGLWLRLSITSCCLLFYYGLCNGAHFNFEIERLAIP